MCVSPCVEWSNVLGNVHLVFLHDIFSPVLLLIFKPCVRDRLLIMGYKKYVTAKSFFFFGKFGLPNQSHSTLSREGHPKGRFPSGNLYSPVRARTRPAVEPNLRRPERSKEPQPFLLLSCKKKLSSFIQRQLFYLLLGYNLSRNEDLVSQIEHVQPNVVGDVSEIHLLFGSQPHLDDVFALFPGDAWHSPHQLINIHLAIAHITSKSRIWHHLSDVFHSIRTIVRRQGTRLSDRVNVPHVSHWGWSDSVTTLQIWVDLILSRIYA